MTLTADDRFAILDVLAAANRAADEKDVAGMMAWYAEGSSIEGDMQASGDRSAFAEGLETIFQNEPGLKRHIGSGHLFEAEGDKAVVRSLLTVFEGDDAPTLVATADIRDELVREDGGWRIARHVVTMDPGTKAAMAAARAG